MTQPTMKAIAFSESVPFQPIEIPVPEPGMTEVLVKTHVAGINPVDWKVRQSGGFPGMFEGDGPKILGWDVAGEVVGVGVGVTRFAVGDRVFGMPHFPRAANCYAEYVTSPSRQLAKIPEGVEYDVAGALPLAGLTAWQAVVDALSVEKGHRILIHAAAGGVGHLAIQIAKARGAEVWGTASAKKHDLLRELGCDHPIDYRTEDFTKVATEMDSVIDFIGGVEHSTRSLESLKQGGKLIVIPSPEMPSEEALKAKDVWASWLLVEPDHKGLEGLAQLLQEGKLKVLIADSKPLSEVAALHELSESGATTGKLIATL